MKSMQPRATLLIFLVTITYLLAGCTEKSTVYDRKTTAKYPGETLINNTHTRTPQPINDIFANWNVHKSRFGYSIKYPKHFNFLDGQNSAFDIQLVDDLLRMSFVVEGLPKGQLPSIYMTSGFCLVQKSEIKEDIINGNLIYRSSKVYEKSDTCLNAVTALKLHNLTKDADWIINIEGKAKDQSGIKEFDDILSTLELSK